MSNPGSLRDQLDQTELVRLLALYGVAVDCRQWETFGEIFTRDVVADYGGIAFEGLEQFQVGAAQAWGGFDSSQHAMLSPAWRVSGDTVKTLTYGTWFIMRGDVEGDTIWEGRGWYDDEWVNVEGKWLIRRRSNRVVSWQGNPKVVLGPQGTAADIATFSLQRETERGTVRFWRD